VGCLVGSEFFPNADVSWGHEPLGIPLSRPTGNFSLTGGEGWDEGVRFMGSQKNRNESADAVSKDKVASLRPALMVTNRRTDK
jgi:hypothetical protein